MTAGRRPSWVWGLFLEYLVAGVATAVGEAAVTEAVKAIKRHRKRRRRAEATNTQPPPL